MRLVLLALGAILAFAKPGNAAEIQIAILTGTPSGIWYPLGMTLSSMQTKLRAIARIYPNFVQFVASNQSGVKTLTDLKGKRVSIGPEASGGAVDAAQIFKAAGFTAADLANVTNGPFGPSFRKVSQGELDAAMISGGLGIEVVRHLLASTHATLVAIPPEIVSKIGNVAYVAATIPTGTYDGQPADVSTTGVANLVFTREGVGDDVAYLMTKSLFEHLCQLLQTDPAAKGIDIKTATVGVPIPLHPGAERYYRESGILK
jgi:hypothetical protein